MSVVVIMVVINQNKGFFGFFVCLLAAVNNVKIRIYRGRITYGQGDRQQLNSIVVMVQNRFLLVLVA